MEEEAEKVDTRMRIPKPLYDRVKDLAQREHRSINAQVIVLLEEAIQQRDQRPGSKSETDRGNSQPMLLAA